MSSLVIDCYINIPILDVLDDGQPIFHRVVLPISKDEGAPAQPKPTATSTAESALIVTNATQIHASEHTSVFHASLDLDGDGELIDVVLKISTASPRNDAALNEYLAYKELVKLQGKMIPRCYGLFQAVVAADDAEEEQEPDVVSCLVLGYGGESAAAELNKNSREFNLSIIKALETLHDAGYTHGSIQASNILNKQGSPILIDLEFTKGDHKCKRVVSVAANNLEYKSGDFGCPEIYNTARKMDLWKKSA